MISNTIVRFTDTTFAGTNRALYDNNFLLLIDGSLIVSVNDGVFLLLICS